MGRGRPRHRDSAEVAFPACPLTQYLSMLLLEHWNSDDWDIVLMFCPTRGPEYEAAVEHVRNIAAVGLGVAPVSELLVDPIGEVILGWEGHQSAIHPHTWITMVVALHCHCSDSRPIGDQLGAISLMILVAYLPYMSPELTVALKLWFERVVALRAADPFEQQFIPHVRRFLNAATMIVCATYPAIRATLAQQTVPAPDALDSILEDTFLDNRANGLWRDGVSRLLEKAGVDRPGP